jgi:micrococcal nuclease
VRCFRTCQRIFRTNVRISWRGRSDAAIVAAMRGIAALLLFVAFPALAEVLPGPVLATVLRVYDGDTFKARARIWLGQDVEIWVRLRGVDTPEIGRRAKCDAEALKGYEARDRLVELLRAGAVELREFGPDKYGSRIDARVFAGGVDVAERLVGEGLGRHYSGGRRAGWC